MPKTAAERKAEERARRNENGLRRFEVWLHPSDWPVVQRLVERLQKRRQHVDRAFAWLTDVMADERRDWFAVELATTELHDRVQDFRGAQKA